DPARGGGRGLVASAGAPVAARRAGEPRSDAHLVGLRLHPRRAALRARRPGRDRRGRRPPLDAAQPLAHAARPHHLRGADGGVRNRGTPLTIGGGPPPPPQIFSTCPYSSSTGVE